MLMTLPLKLRVDTAAGESAETLEQVSTVDVDIARQS
jgi:hypothetical protein